MADMNKDTALTNDQLYDFSNVPVRREGGTVICDLAGKDWGKLGFKDKHPSQIQFGAGESKVILRDRDYRPTQQSQQQRQT